MDDATGLTALEARVAEDLRRIAWPAGEWVKPKAGPDGEPALNVLIVGAGQGGLALGFQLMRERVDRVAIVDRAAPSGRGPWKTYGRMITLRSPKQTTGPDLDVASLTFQSWFEAQHGAPAWDALGKIPKEMWADYLDWYARVLDLPVQSPVEVVAIEPGPGMVAMRLREDGQERVVHARHVVLATGIESTGGWWMPDFCEALPTARRNHTGDAIDFAALAGKRVAILGAGASAFDNAATALEAGAGEVHLFWRRPAIQRVQPYKHISYTGFLRHLGDLDDARRWAIMRHVLTLREAFPAETWARVTRHPNAHLHEGAGWTGARVTEDGEIEIETADATFRADHVIIGTGFDVDPARDPLLGAFASDIARWADRYAPPPGEEDARLARYPYLGPGFELVAREGADEGLDRVKVFTFAATMSFGPSGSSINALKFAVPRLVAGITRALFVEDADAHHADLLAYDTPEF